MCLTTLTGHRAPSPYSVSRGERCSSLRFGRKDLLGASIPAGAKPRPTPPTAQPCSATQCPHRCCSASSAPLRATHSTFCNIFSRVTCCNTLLRSRSRFLLPPKRCYKNQAVTDAQRPPPFPPHLSRLALFLAISSHLRALNTRQLCASRE